MPSYEWSGANLFAGLLFGAVGCGGFIYGRKQDSMKTMFVSFLLISYPFVITQTIVIYVLGMGLTALLFLWRD